MNSVRGVLQTLNVRGLGNTQSTRVYQGIGGTADVASHRYHPGRFAIDTGGTVQAVARRDP